jgi:hypothetical protein
MEISILGSKKTLNSVECLLHSQPPCGVIRTTADYFLLPNMKARVCGPCDNFFSVVEERNSLAFLPCKRAV